MKKIFGNLQKNLEFRRNGKQLFENIFYTFRFRIIFRNI